MGITETTRGFSRRFPVQNQWISYPQLHTPVLDASSPHVPIHAQAPIYQQAIHDRGKVFPNIVRMLFHNPHHLSTRSARLSTFACTLCRFVTLCARQEPGRCVIQMHAVGVDRFRNERGEADSTRLARLSRSCSLCSSRQPAPRRFLDLDRASRL